MKRLILLLMMIPLLFASCEKQEDPILSVSLQSIDAPDNGNSTPVKLFSTNKWTVSAPNWCKVTPAGGEGTVGEIEITVQVLENDTYEERTGDIKFTSGELTSTIKVTQVANKGVVLPKNEYKVSSEAQQLEVTVKANVKYNVDIDVDWITQAGTKALESTTYLFDILANEEYEKRVGRISIIEEGTTDSITILIEQVQQDAIFVGLTEYSLSCKEHTLDIEVQTNVELEISIPEEAKSWVSHVETKSLEDKTVVLKVAANEDYDPRTCEILVKKKGGDYSETIYIYQEELIGVVLSEKEFNISSQKQDLEVKYSTNAYVDIEVAPEGKEWITVGQTKALEDKTVILSVKENSTYDIRESKVFFKIDGSEITDTINIIQKNKDTLYIQEKLFNVVKEGATITVKVNSTVEYDVEILNDWITNTSTKALAENSNTFAIAANEEVQGRNGYIAFKSKTTNHTDTVTVNQNGSGGYIWYNGIQASQSVPGNGTESDPYIIHTANDLQWLINQAEYGTQEVLEQNNYDVLKTNITIGKYYRLTHDLTIDSDYDVVDGSGNVIQAKGWTPIGSGYGDDYHSRKLQTFIGHFDGGGHTIDGKMVPVNNSLSVSGVQYFGLFGYCETYYDSHSGNDFSASIKNVNMNVTVECDKQVTKELYQGYSTIMAGALLGFGRGQQLNIENCTIKGSVRAGMSTGDLKIYSSVGGMIGYFGGANIINCHNYSTVTGGYSTGPVADMRVGGLVGEAYSSNLNIVNCTNNGKVTSGNVLYTLYIGGIGGLFNDCSMTNSHNYGDITGGAVTYDQPADRYSIKPNMYVGGILGYADGYNMVNCSNSGTITSGKLAVNDQPYQATGSVLNIGGLCGFFHLSAQDCTNKGNIIVDSSEQAYVGGVAGEFCGAEAQRCTNYGKITYIGEIRDSYLGGFSGSSGTQKMIECVNYADVIGPKNVKYGCTGGLSGDSGDNIILRSANKGNVIGSQSTIDNGYTHIGGLTGKSQSSGTIEDCINEGNVTALDTKGTVYIGGLTSISSNRCRLYASVNKGDVMCGGAMTSATGGVIGYIDSYSVIESCINEGAVIGGRCTYDYNATTIPFYMTACTGGIAGVIRSNGVIKGGCTNKGNIIPGSHQYGRTTYDGSLVGYSVHNTTTICTCTKDESGSTLNILGGGYLTIKEDSSCSSH